MKREKFWGSALEQRDGSLDRLRTEHGETFITEQGFGELFLLKIYLSVPVNECNILLYNHF